MPLWVVAALGFQVLVSSIGLAATTCTDTLERTRVTRVAGPVAQAIRELVERRAIREPVTPRTRDEIETVPALRPAHAAPVIGFEPDLGLLDLPPPAMG